jgi:hypothetical protein
MSPLFIVTGFFGLREAISKVSVISAEFTCNARYAMSDLDVLLSNLQTLSPSISRLRC